MRTQKILPVALMCSLIFLPAAAGAEGVPNFKKRGDLEKRFVSEVCVGIIKAARTSAKKRRRASGLSSSAGLTTLMATGRSMTRCSAKKTLPMPPAPSGRKTRNFG